MSLAATVRAMAQAGCTSEQVAAVVEAFEAVEQAKKAERRAKDAERQRKFRGSRPAESRDVTVTTCDRADETPKEKAPQTPKKENPPSKENPPKGGQKKGSPLPAGWTPEADDWRQALQTLGIQRAEIELAKFRDYWPGVPGEKGRKLDWNGTWRNWIRKAAEYARGSPGKPRSASLVELAFPELRGHDDQPSEQHHTGQHARPTIAGGSGFAGSLSERGGDDSGGPLLDLRPARAGW